MVINVRASEREGLGVCWCGHGLDPSWFDLKLAENMHLDAGRVAHMSELRPRTALGLAAAASAVAYLALRAYRRRQSKRSTTLHLSPTSLDPKSDEEWRQLRAHAHALLDKSFDKMEVATEGRTWTPPPQELKVSLQAPLPEAGITHDELCRKLCSLLPYSVGNCHPRFFGWVHGSGNVGGVLPELVAAAMNANCGGRDHIAIYVERQVLAWCRCIVGFPDACGALLVSGTSMATVVALKAARDSRLGFAASRTGGVRNASQQKQLVGYAAEGAHSCVKRAFDLLGIGSNYLKLVRTNDDFTIDVAALKAMHEADVAAGLEPFLVVGTCGSVNVGAVDDCDALATFAKEHNLWLHIDGAFGAAAVLCEGATIKEKLRGLNRADSLAFDFHKWFHVNYDCGIVLVRSHDAHIRAFSERPDYLAASTNGKGIAANNPWPTDYGPELSRGFRALKVWAHLLEHGTRKLGLAITANLEHAQHLGKLVDAASELQRLAPVALNIVVFRYLPPGWSGENGGAEKVDALNDAIVVELQERGIAAPSTTRVRGRLAIRVNLTNHRTRFEDLDLLVEAVVRVGRELSSEA